MDLKREVSPDTKVDKNAAAIRTALTIDFVNVTADHIMEYAIDALIVKWQAKVRKANHIPAKDTYIVPVPGTRTATLQPENMEDAQLQALILRCENALKAKNPSIIIRKKD
jgi:hypothetical protein